jgi:hypothetical protein
MISKSALFISCVATVTALKCNDNNDALLQVKYIITQDEWNRTRPSGLGDLIHPFLELPGNLIKLQGHLHLCILLQEAEVSMLWWVCV